MAGRRPRACPEAGLLIPGCGLRIRAESEIAQHRLGNSYRHLRSESRVYSQSGLPLFCPEFETLLEARREKMSATVKAYRYICNITRHRGKSPSPPSTCTV